MYMYGPKSQKTKIFAKIHGTLSQPTKAHEPRNDQIRTISLILVIILAFFLRKLPKSAKMIQGRVVDGAKILFW